jgi:hypothetical protein
VTGDAFVNRFNSTGTGLVYSTYIGGRDADSGAAIAVDVAGNAYVTGDTQSTAFQTTAGALQPTFLGSQDPTTGDFPVHGFVSKVNTTATALAIPPSSAAAARTLSRRSLWTGLGTHTSPAAQPRRTSSPLKACSSAA